MEIYSESVLEHEPQKVYEAYRDKLPEIAEYIPNVSKIEVLEREELDGGVKLQNLWHAESKIPRAARSIITPEMLKWVDFAHWDDKKNECNWKLETKIFPESVSCSGTTRFIAQGRNHTQVILKGDLQISLDNIPGVPRMLRSTLTPQIEKFVVSLITPNLARVCDALGEYLDAAD